MLTATCHCGAVRVTVPRAPRTVTDCTCSICRRYGVLWGYYEASTVRVEAAPEALHRYAWGPKSQYFLRCATCGCIMCWQKIPPTREPNMGVNARNFEPEILRSIPVEPMDGASF